MRWPDDDDELPPWQGERYRDIAVALIRGEHEPPIPKRKPHVETEDHPPSQ